MKFDHNMARSQSLYVAARRVYGCLATPSNANSKLSRRKLGCHVCRAVSVGTFGSQTSQSNAYSYGSDSPGFLVQSQQPHAKEKWSHFLWTETSQNSIGKSGKAAKKSVSGFISGKSSNPPEADGCFSCSFCKASLEGWAGLSSEQIILMAALRLPSSSLAETACANYYYYYYYYYYWFRLAEIYRSVPECGNRKRHKVVIRIKN